MASVLPVVGLRREREVLTVALATGRHVVIEAPPPEAGPRSRRAARSQRDGEHLPLPPQPDDRRHRTLCCANGTFVR